MAKLEKFKKNSDKPTVKQILIAAGIIVVLLGGFALYKSFALYTANESHDVVKAKVKDFKKAEYVSYDNSYSGLDCADENANVKCDLKKIEEMVGN